MIERGAERKFDQSCVFYFSYQRKYLCSGAFFGASGAEPFAAFFNYHRHITPCFHIVYIGGFAIKSVVGRVGRTRLWSTGFSFDRSDQSRFLATNKCASTFHHTQVKTEVGSQDVFAHQSQFGSLLDGHFQSFYGQRIFGPHVGYSFGSAHGISAKHHTFDKRMRIAFNLVAVHVCSGIAFVGIADYVFLIGFFVVHNLPFAGCRETCASATT